MERTESDLFAARLSDMLRASERGEVALSPFLTPEEGAEAERFFRLCGATERLRLWGGYPAAERRRAYLLPEYLTVSPDLMPPMDTDPAETLSDERLAGAVSAVRIEGSGYRELSHRDHLGSLLALGLERDALGDLAVQDAHTAVVFCTARVAEFLCTSLERVANDRVRCTPYRPDASFSDGRRTVPVTDTVASARLDCAVAALANCSREAARSAIASGRISVDHVLADRPDRTLEPPCLISVRGVGRFRLLPYEGETRRGRLRLRAEKFV